MKRLTSSGANLPEKQSGKSRSNYSRRRSSLNKETGSGISRGETIRVYNIQKETCKGLDQALDAIFGKEDDTPSVECRAKAVSTDTVIPLPPPSPENQILMDTVEMEIIEELTAIEK